jgi:Tfp pilus assembly protein PilW
MKTNLFGSKKGFTILEVMIASSISTMTLGALMASFIWTMRQSHETNTRAWAQVESLKSSVNMIDSIRNASRIDSIDGEGNWVELRYPDGSIGRLSYRNESGQAGAGFLLYEPDLAQGNVSLKLVAKGVSKVMTTPVRNVFERTSPRSLRVAYRVTKPLAPVDVASEVDIGVCLRNY